MPNESAAGSKTCTKCGATKPLDAFYRNAQSADGRHPQCKACRSAALVAYRERERVTINARKRDAYASNPGAQREWNRAWRNGNRPARRLQHQRRRALLAEATSCAAFTAEEMLRDWESRGLTGCSYCPGEFESIDHVIPLKRGGAHELANLAPACISCNSSKRDSLLDEWLPRHVERLRREGVVSDDWCPPLAAQPA
ncbi:MAG: HNH endonuclease [Actinobacteria bacterium]|nr:HNH endonuclease [Actinomycetota bacterium]